MLTFEQIEQQYPEPLRVFKKNILREYVQYKILEVIFASPYAAKLSFLGGTALRIVYGNARFSEDLDFDNFGLREAEFLALARIVKAGIEKEGFEVETCTTAKGAYRCRIKLPDVLFAHALSPHKGEKLMIQIDTAPHHFPYTPDRKILNKFDVLTAIAVTPAPILLSQKIYAALHRKRAKGRDFYDILFLLSFTKPHYGYLKEKVGIDSAQQLREKLLAATRSLPLKELARDVQQFLFNPNDAKRIELFSEFIRDVSLE